MDRGGQGMDWGGWGMNWGGQGMDLGGRGMDGGGREMDWGGGHRMDRGLTGGTNLLQNRSTVHASRQAKDIDPTGHCRRLTYLAR